MEKHAISNKIENTYERTLVVRYRSRVNKGAI